MAVPGCLNSHIETRHVFPGAVRHPEIGGEGEEEMRHKRKRKKRAREEEREAEREAPEQRHKEIK